MNLKALFETQAKLDEDILVKHPVQEGEDRLSKKILALQAELGELANEVRSWKFWSNDQEPRFNQYYFKDDFDRWYPVSKEDWQKTWGYPEDAEHEGEYWKVRNLVLEEYVDCLHLILSIGIGAKVDFESSIKNLNHNKDWLLADRDIKKTTITDQLIMTFGSVNDYERMRSVDEYFNMMAEFFILGTLLGFTDDMVEAVYYEKNKINHQRQ